MERKIFENTIVFNKIIEENVFKRIFFGKY